MHMHPTMLERSQPAPLLPLRVPFSALCRRLLPQDSFVLHVRPKRNQVGPVIPYDKGPGIRTSSQETAVRHGVSTGDLGGKAPGFVILFTFLPGTAKPNVADGAEISGVFCISEHTPQTLHPC